VTLSLEKGWSPGSFFLFLFSVNLATKIQNPKCLGSEKNLQKAAWAIALKTTGKQSII
jgi:hypothetical protein